MPKATKLLNIDRVTIYGETTSYQTQPSYCRYALDIPTVPWGTLSMQEMAGGDNNRTSAIFQAPDI